MAKPESKAEYAFQLSSYGFMGETIVNKVYKIVVVKNGLISSRPEDALQGEYTQTEKENLEALRNKIQAPNFRR